MYEALKQELAREVWCLVSNLYSSSASGSGSCFGSVVVASGSGSCFGSVVVASGSVWSSTGSLLLTRTVHHAQNVICSGNE